MMYSDFNVWRDETNRIVENLKHATPQKAMEELLYWKTNEVQNNINQLKCELNSGIINTSITNTNYNFGRDEKGRMIFTAKQAARATIDSYKVGWFQYIWNLIDYKRAEHYVLKRIKERASKGFATACFSDIRWPFYKFPELIERLEFLGFEDISTDDWEDIKFRWDTII